MKKIVAITVFNIIETVGFLAGVGVWFALHDTGHKVLGAVLGTLVWSAITQIEHITAFNTGAGLPFLSIPKN